ncbi:NGFI-A-binding protein homolog isoform X2 [Aphidius gifuensis]|uniref:NGFI-A-binding protein homolog isoform X2 n=1 Tax=Aphidius gifuensis TaxID=684658 RepID=UPI001CDBD244|nr:NGFI-A-binding protein homolog isoform X2 [Aphidius gifuensis]
METRIGVSSGGITGTSVEPVRCVTTPSPVHQPQTITISSSSSSSSAITPTATSTTSSINSISSSITTSTNNAIGSISGIAAAVAAAAASITTGTSSMSPTGATPVSGSSGPRILSRNVNGTLVQTSVPQNEAELQLYRVMQRASLLGYYDTLLEMGGDDVQQLCDAGEEEFLEIMALVGMASKPLHVRRLQKALQEWITNPSIFQSPVVPTTSTKNSTSTVTTFPSSSPRIQSSSGFNSTSQTTSPTTLFDKAPTNNVPLVPLSSRSVSPVTPVATVVSTAAILPTVPTSTFRQSPSPNTPIAYSGGQSPGVLQVGTCESSCGSGTTLSPGGLNAPQSPTQAIPTLLPSQVQRLADAAERLAGNLRPLDPKPHNVKKKICKDLEMVMAMPDTDPRRMDEIRKYAAIYGRFDCKRKPEKPLTLHEVSVNEAAAQICRFVPALLTRRDELFPLARRVVRDSGYHYSKSQFLSMTRPRDNCDDSDMDRAKRRHLDDPEGEDTSQMELDLRCTGGGDINNSILRSTSSPVWRKKNNNGVFGTSIEEISDTDSQFSFSNDESSLHDPNDFENDNTDKESEFNLKYFYFLKIIASRGDNIIAVANPALMNCSHPIKKENDENKSTL